MMKAKPKCSAPRCREEALTRIRGTWLCFRHTQAAINTSLGAALSEAELDLAVFLAGPDGKLN
jgi:hypothetical protein